MFAHYEERDTFYDIAADHLDLKLFTHVYRKYVSLKVLKTCSYTPLKSNTLLCFLSSILCIELHH